MAGAFDELGSYVFDPAEIATLESAGYISVQRREPPLNPRFALTEEGERIALPSANPQ